MYTKELLKKGKWEVFEMKKIIYKITMCKSKRYLIGKYSKEWYKNFQTLSLKTLHEVCKEMPDIGKSIFSFNYQFAPSYIAWYKAMETLGIKQEEIIQNIWTMNERMMKIIPNRLMHLVGKSYLKSFRKKSKKHIERQKAGKLHPYDWQIEYKDIDSNCFEIDIKTCGIKKLAETFGAEGLLPGICRMDYLFSSMMNNGFSRTKTLGDGDDCCNCRYELIGHCEWAPEKGFIDRK